MDTRLFLWVALAIAVVTVVGAFLTGSGDKAELAHPRPWWSTTGAGKLALALPFVGFLVTLPSTPPLFASGHGLGIGGLIGGIGALVFAAVSAWRASDHNDADAGGAAFALPALVAAVPLLWGRAFVLDALFGAALGWFAVAVLLHFTSTATHEAAEVSPAPPRLPSSLPLVFGTVVMGAVAVAAALGVLRDEHTPALARGTWSTVVIALAAGGGLVRAALSVVAPFRTTTTRTVAVSPFLTVGLVAVMGLLAATKLTNDIRLFSTLVAGLLLWPVVVWMSRERSPQSSAPSSREGNGQGGLSPLLLLVGGFMLCGQLMGGYGTALWCLGAAFTAAALLPTTRTDRAVHELRLLLFALTLVLFRAASARWSDSLHQSAFLADQYALFGVVIGAASPGLFAQASEMLSGGKPIGRAVTAGLLTILLPGAVVVLFGAKCVLPLLIGVALGSVMGGGAGGVGLTAALLAVGMGLTVDQLLGRALPLAEWTRPERLKALGILVGLIAVVMFAARVRGGNDKSAMELPE